MLRVEDFVAVHYCDEVFGVAEVYDVMGVAREHNHALDFVSADFEFYHFVGAFFALLDESVTFDNDELLPLGVMPVLALSDARFADVDADLPTARGVHQLCERTTLVAVHLEIEDGFVLWQVAEVSAKEFLCKAVRWDFWDH